MKISFTVEKFGGHWGYDLVKTTSSLKEAEELYLKLLRTGERDCRIVKHTVLKDSNKN